MAAAAAARGGRISDSRARWGCTGCVAGGLTDGLEHHEPGGHAQGRIRTSKSMHALHVGNESYKIMSASTHQASALNHTSMRACMRRHAWAHT
eukprot:1161226-Pelagomonas_calceolata.AAC.11